MNKSRTDEEKLRGGRFWLINGRSLQQSGLLCKQSPGWKCKEQAASPHCGRHTWGLQVVRGFPLLQVSSTHIPGRPSWKSLSEFYTGQLGQYCVTWGCYCSWLRLRKLWASKASLEAHGPMVLRSDLEARYCLFPTKRRLIWEAERATALLGGRQSVFQDGPGFRIEDKLESLSVGLICNPRAIWFWFCF